MKIVRNQNIRVLKVSRLKYDCASAQKLELEYFSSLFVILLRNCLVSLADWSCTDNPISRLTIVKVSL